MRRGQFYGIRYHSKKFRDSMKEALSWDYTKAKVRRNIPGWGRIKVIGSYADYIKHVNDRVRRKHE